jgi:hypothetical protein
MSLLASWTLDSEKLKVKKEKLSAISGKIAERKKVPCVNRFAIESKCVICASVGNVMMMVGKGVMCNV